LRMLTCNTLLIVNSNVKLTQGDLKNDKVKLTHPMVFEPALGTFWFCDRRDACGFLAF